MLPRKTRSSTIEAASQTGERGQSRDERVKATLSVAAECTGLPAIVSALPTSQLGLIGLDIKMM